MTEVQWEEVEAELDRSAHSWTTDLIDFCSIASEADNASELDAAAAWVGDRLASVAQATRVLSSAGSPPLVVAEVGSTDGARMVNAVQHYDVQPAGNTNGWRSPPYAPEIRDGRLYARGASDNKGEFLLRVWAVEAYRRAVGDLPCGVRFLVEGEEETGSRNLARLLAKAPSLLAADAALGEAGGVDQEGRPIVDAGNRGMLYVKLTVRTLARDAHSGAATLLPNAAARLVAALGTLVRPDGAPAWDGLHDGIAPLSAAARASIRAMPLELLEQLRSEYSVTTFVGGRDGFEAFEADLSRPTCNIQAMWSGDVAPQGRNVVPAEATARLDLRLVPDQDPARIHELMRSYLDDHGFADVELEQAGPPARAYWTDLDDPVVEAASAAVEWAFGKPAIRMQSMSGTAPMHDVCAGHRVPMVYIGGADLQNNAHAPDESISLSTARTAAVAFLRFITNVAALER